jgi:hypothetical protein
MYKQIAALLLILAFVPANNVLFYALLLMSQVSDVEYTHDDGSQTHRISVGLVKLIKFGFALQMSRPPPRTRQRLRVRPPRPSVRLGALNWI